MSCRVLGDRNGVATAFPDGWWYRIASSPWNNNYYVVANTMLNGDPDGGPFLPRYTDFSVPVCA